MGGQRKRRPPYIKRSTPPAFGNTACIHYYEFTQSAVTSAASAAPAVIVFHLLFVLNGAARALSLPLNTQIIFSEENLYDKSFTFYPFR